MGRVKDYYHDEICAGASDVGNEPSELDMLEAAKVTALTAWLSLIKNGASEEEKAKARLASFAARDAYWDAGGR